MINQDQYIRFLKNIRNVKTEIKLDVPNNNEKRKWFADPEKFGCHCGKEVGWITQLGDFTPCFFFGRDFIVGNIRNEDFLTLWHRAKEKVEIGGNEICKNCLGYKNCRGGCRARALWEYNDINAVDPLCPLRKNCNP